MTASLDQRRRELQRVLENAALQADARGGDRDAQLALDDARAELRELEHQAVGEDAL